MCWNVHRKLLFCVHIHVKASCLCVPVSMSMTFLADSMWMTWEIVYNLCDLTILLHGAPLSARFHVIELKKSFLLYCVFD